MFTLKILPIKNLFARNRKAKKQAGQKPARSSSEVRTDSWSKTFRLLNDSLRIPFFPVFIPLFLVKAGLIDLDKEKDFTGDNSQEIDDSELNHELGLLR